MAAQASSRHTAQCGKDGLMIADSGSTKTTWQTGQLCIRTQGINPFHQSADSIKAILTDELMPQIASVEVNEIVFYGAGCTAEKSLVLSEVLAEVFTSSNDIQVGSDMLGAARALCQHSPGIACILGTGANSCYYDGKEIQDNVPPLGYVLGDEGSAAYIGKRLVADILKRQMPNDVCKMFHDETGLDTSTIINNVYRMPMPNRFLGETSRFCANHRNHVAIHNLLTDCFTQFFRRNVMSYQHTDLPVHFVGSVAKVYEEEIHEAATGLGLKIGTIMSDPMPGLLTYHASDCK